MERAHDGGWNLLLKVPSQVSVTLPRLTTESLKIQSTYSPECFSLNVFVHTSGGVCVAGVDFMAFMAFTAFMAGVDSMAGLAGLYFVVFMAAMAGEVFVVFMADLAGEVFMADLAGLYFVVFMAAMAGEDFVVCLAGVAGEDVNYLIRNGYGRHG